MLPAESENDALMDRRTHGWMDGQTDVRPILNIWPVYKGPLIRGQVSEITGRLSSEFAR